MQMKHEERGLLATECTIHPHLYCIRQSRLKHGEDTKLPVRLSLSQVPDAQHRHLHSQQHSCILLSLEPPECLSGLRALVL